VRLADNCCSPVPVSIGDVLGGLPPARGGCGKAAMLTVLRRVFSGLLGSSPVEVDLKGVILKAELDCPDPPMEGRGDAGGRSFEGI
jgi:hypothetical protein